MYYIDVYTFIFVTIVSLVIFFTIRDWLNTARFSPYRLHRMIKTASQYALLENWQEADELLSTILEARHESKEIALLQTQVLRGTNRLNEAFEIVKKASRLYPEELQFRMEEGLILLQMDRPQEALSSFQVCAPIIRAESDVIALASALNRVGNPSQAFELLEPWMKFTHNGPLLALVGEIYFEKKEFHHAITYYEKAIGLGHDRHQVVTQLGTAYRRFGNLAEAERIFRALIEKDPFDIIATLGLGACIQERGHYTKALLIYQTSKVWERKNPHLLKEAGLCALRTGKNGYAESYFSEVMQQTLPEASLFAYYALALENQNKWQKAEQVYLNFIKLFPSHTQGYRALAWLFGVGLSCTISQEEGLSYAHIALKLKNDSTSWEILSACEARVGNFERAHAIQTTLASQDASKEERSRRQQVLRNLRKHHPLDNQHVARSLVA